MAVDGSAGMSPADSGAVCATAADVKSESIRIETKLRGLITHPFVNAQIFHRGIRVV
jgi:hypothetical protein